MDLFTRTLRAFACLWLAISLIAGPAVVWCDGADGHDGFELAHVDGCGDEGSAAAVVDPHADRGDACDDVTLLPAARTDRLADGPRLSLLPVSLPLMVASADAMPKRPLPPLASAHPPPSPHLVSLAGVVLLI